MKHRLNAVGTNCLSDCSKCFLAGGNRGLESGGAIPPFALLGPGVITKIKCDNMLFLIIKSGNNSGNLKSTQMWFHLEAIPVHVIH